MFLEGGRSSLMLAILRDVTKQRPSVAVNTVPAGFRRSQALKNNQNSRTHCHLIICHKLLAPLAGIYKLTKYTRNAKHTKESVQPAESWEEFPLISSPSHPFPPPFCHPLFLCLVIRLHTFVESAHSSRATVESWLCLAYPTTGILMNMSQHSGREKELRLSNATITSPFKKLRFNAGPRQIQRSTRIWQIGNIWPSPSRADTTLCSQ